MDKLNLSVSVQDARTLGKNKNVKERVIHIRKDDMKTLITPDEVKKIMKDIEDTAHKNGDKIKTMVRGLNKTRWNCFKRYDSELDMVDEHDYMRGRVADAKDYSNFYQLEIHIAKY